MRAVVAAHAAAADAPTSEGATPAVAASAPLIRAAAVAPAPLGSAPELHMSTPVVRVVVAQWRRGKRKWGLRDLGPSKAAARSARRALSTKPALVAVADVEIRRNQKVDNQVVYQVDARRG